MLQTEIQNLINIWQHMSKAGGHDDSSSKTHQAWEDSSKSWVSIWLLPAKPASLDGYQRD